MAEQERRNDRRSLADPFEGRAREYDHDVKIVKVLMRSGEAGSGVTLPHLGRKIAVNEDAKQD
jgi:hypothetical protein